jgi:hypothetical protein
MAGEITADSRATSPGIRSPLHPPPTGFCLYNVGLYELGIDPADVLPPLKPT